MDRITDLITSIVIVAMIVLTFTLIYRDIKDTNTIKERTIELKKDKCLNGNMDACDYYFLSTGKKIKPLP